MATKLNPKEFNTSKDISNLFLTNYSMTGEMRNQQDEMIKHTSDPEKEFFLQFGIPEFRFRICFDAYDSPITGKYYLKINYYEYEDDIIFEISNTHKQYSVNNLNEVINTCINYAENLYNEINNK